MHPGSIFETILVGDDGTPEAGHAVDATLSLAGPLKAKVILVGIVPAQSAESQAEGTDVSNPSQVRKRLEAKLEDTATQARSLGIEVVVEILDGQVEHELEARAEAHSADLIVVGQRNISRVRHWLEGSISETLVRSSRISILVVRT